MPNPFESAAESTKLDPPADIDHRLNTFQLQRQHQEEVAGVKAELEKLRQQVSATVAEPTPPVESIPDKEVIETPLSSVHTSIGETATHNALADSGNRNRNGRIASWIVLVASVAAVGSIVHSANSKPEKISYQPIERITEKSPTPSPKIVIASPSPEKIEKIEKPKKATPSPEPTKTPIVAMAARSSSTEQTPAQSKPAASASKSSTQKKSSRKKPSVRTGGVDVNAKNVKKPAKKTTPVKKKPVVGGATLEDTPATGGVTPSR